MSFVLLFNHGYWEQARSRLLGIYREHCHEQLVGLRAFELLMRMARELESRGEVEQLERVQRERQCGGRHGH